MSTDTSDQDADGAERGDDGSIIVPMRMYKGITVFSTLVATGLVVLGFFMFDAATHPINPIRQGAVWVIGLSGWTPPAGLVNVGFGLAGVAVILLGAGTYILGTRFKTADMIERSEEDEETA